MKTLTYPWISFLFLAIFFLFVNTWTLKSEEGSSTSEEGKTSSEKKGRGQGEKKASDKGEKRGRKGVPERGPVTEVEKEKFKQALFSGDASYFEKMPPEDIVITDTSECYSLVQDICLENYDKIPQAIQALVGGLKNKDKNVGNFVVNELAYLSPLPLFKPGNEKILAAVRDALKEKPSVKISPANLENVRARYSVSPVSVEAKKEVTDPKAILENRRVVPITEIGERRATCYTMTSLFFRQNGSLFFSWMEKPLINCLGVLRPDFSAPIVEAVIGRPTDDHGNAACVQDINGKLHALVGSHHGPFVHRMADDPEKPYAWRKMGDVGEKSTHPSLLCDRKGVLHLVYRSSTETPWLVMYQRFVDGKWTPPVSLLRAGVNGYYTWTNTLAVGPDNTLHLIVSNCRGDPTVKGDTSDCYWGASHIYSEDGGMTWLQYGDKKPLSLPASVKNLATIEAKSEASKRSLPHQEYMDLLKADETMKIKVTLQMLLSNAVVDEKNRPWVVEHNTLEKTASLCCAENGEWKIKADIAKAVQDVMPGWGIAEQSALSRHKNGYLEAVLPIIPFNNRPPKTFVGWQNNELELIRILFDAEGKVLGAKLVKEINPKEATWQPNLEKWDWNHPFDHPALLFSSGFSDPPRPGVASSVKNAVVMKVFLDVVKD